MAMRNFPQDRFVEAHHLRFQLLDWGGQGPYLIILSGIFATAYMFLSLGSRLADQFRVLALTRRGLGRSDKPEDGYDANTLVEDIAGVCDALNVDSAYFAGWSFAGIELSSLAAKYPERVRKLIYLDAAYDYCAVRDVMERDPLEKYLAPLRAEAIDSLDAYLSSRRTLLPMALAPYWDDRIRRAAMENVEVLPDGRVQMRMQKSTIDQLAATGQAYSPDYSKVESPALAIYAMANEHPEKPALLPEDIKQAADAWWRDESTPAVRKCIEQFKFGIPSGRVLELPDTCHACFIQREDEVSAAMRQFLED